MPLEPILLVFTCYVIFGSGIWIAIFAYLMWTLRQIPRLHMQTSDLKPPAVWPSLSIIIPACNEAENIEIALASLLAQDYPELEIVVLNDRSTDATGQIIEGLAARDSRIQTLHITELPEGWLGKVHALHQGVKRAHGDWLLFTDADIHFSPGTLQKAMSYALQTQADHLALFPRVLTTSFWLEVAVSSFGLLFLYSTHPAQVHRQDNEYFIGVGAFNLVRREVFDRTPGFPWLRLEPGDDAALGMMIKQAGGRIRVAMAQENLSVRWYPSVAAMFKGLEKNMFGPGAHYQWWRVLLQSIGLWVLLAAPPAGLAVGLYAGSWVLLLIAGITIGIHLLFSVVLAENKPRDSLYLLFFPPGLLLINAMMIRAAYRCLRNGGIDWRGTHYSLTELRAGQRLKF